MSAICSSREAHEGFSTSSVPTGGSHINVFVAAEKDGEVPPLLGQLGRVLLNVVSASSDFVAQFRVWRCRASVLRHFGSSWA